MDAQTAPDDAPRLPDGLLARVKADPLHAPEHLADAAAERHGPAAAKWLSEQSGRRDAAKLAKSIKRQHARYARFGGAATGIGGFYTVVPDLALLLWIQSHMVFFIAAAHGFDPNDRMRPAELLVLWDLYDDPAEARASLDGTGGAIATTYAKRQVGGSGEEDSATARLVRAAANHGGRKLAGKMIPGAAIIFNAVGNERSTRELADDAVRFYGG